LKSTNWKDIAELAGIAAIVLSLLFVGLQLKQGQQLAVEDRVNYTNERQNAIRGLIVANADIWQKACMGEPLEPASRIIAAKIFDAWTDHMNGEIVLRNDGIRQSTDAQQKIVEEYAAQFWVFPGLLELAESRGQWDNGAVETHDSSARSLLGPIFDRIEDRVEYLKSTGVSPSIDTAWCGRT
jgi:hypothetical protein